MNALSDRLLSEPGPLSTDEAIWARVIERANTSLRQSAFGLGEPATAALRVTVAAARMGDPSGPRLLAMVKRSLIRADLQSEATLRCLRALTRAGEPVDLKRLTPFLHGIGRYARMALVAIADRAVFGDPKALSLLSDALHGRWAADAACFLAGLDTDASAAVLQEVVSEPHEVGLHAASAILARTGDSEALRSLRDRLCDAVGSGLAARALLEASPRGEWLARAEQELSDLSHDGDPRVERGRMVASAMLTACGQRADMEAALRLIGAADDSLKLIGAQAAYWLGDADRARTCIRELLNRGPAMATQAFEVLTRWADVGDDRALALHREVVERRPVDLARSAVLEAVAGSPRPVLFSIVSKALTSLDGPLSLEAARAVALLREPPFPVPAYAL